MSLLDAFQVGQQAAGTPALGGMLAELTKRAGELGLAQAKVNMESQAKIATAEPVAYGEQRGKSRALRENPPPNPFANTPWGTGTPPVDTTMTVNAMTGETNYTIPLNKKLESVDSAAISTSRGLLPVIEQLQAKIATKTNAGIAPGPADANAQLGAKAPDWMIGAGKAAAGWAGYDTASFDEASELRALQQQLDFSGFTFGGRQLTDREQQVIRNLTDPVGKPTHVTYQNLELLKGFLKRIEAAIMSGRVGADNAEREAIFQQLWAQSNLPTVGNPAVPTRGTTPFPLKDNGLPDDFEELH